VTAYLGRRIAGLAIRGYRRWLSGRGPLRRVACTFATTESCSAYGLRAVDEVATSLRHALALVRARIDACRCTSIYRFGERGLGWEREHERDPEELARLLERRGERPETIAQVLAAREAVARWRGDHPALVAVLHARAARPPARHPIPVRPGDATIARYRRGVARGVVLATLALVVAVLAAIAAPRFAVPALVPLAGAAFLAARAQRSAHRLIRQRVAAGFVRPRWR
jgi:putative component of membrane protein insertase Oxa1/YidC/SpoIIIJ protein YidD